MALTETGPAGPDRGLRFSDTWLIPRSSNMGYCLGKGRVLSFQVIVILAPRKRQMIDISSTENKRENSETVRSCNRRKGRWDHNLYSGVTVKAVNQKPGTESSLRSVEKPTGLQKMSFLPSHLNLTLRIILCDRPLTYLSNTGDFYPGVSVRSNSNRPVAHFIYTCIVDCVQTTVFPAPPLTPATVALTSSHKLWPCSLTRNLTVPHPGGCSRLPLAFYLEGRPCSELTQGQPGNVGCLWWMGRGAKK